MEGWIHWQTEDLCFEAVCEKAERNLFFKAAFFPLWTKFTLMLLIPPSPAILLNMPSVQTVSQYYGSSSLGLFVSRTRAVLDDSQATIIVTSLSYLSYTLLFPFGDTLLYSMLMRLFSFQPFTLAFSVNPYAQRTPRDIKNKKPWPRTYLWAINWNRFLVISICVVPDEAFCRLLRPPLISAPPELDYSSKCLCLFYSWINTIAWELLSVG